MKITLTQTELAKLIAQSFADKVGGEDGTRLDVGVDFNIDGGTLITTVTIEDKGKR